MDVLLTYIAGSSVTLLENTLVEKEQLCSAVYHYNETRPDEVIWFTLSSVATKKLADVEKRFFEVLRDAVSKPFDMAYIKDCILRFRRQVKYATEASHSIFHSSVIEDHLFGNRDGSDLYKALSNLDVFDVLLKWTDQQWRSFTKSWLADAHHVSILGVPSAELAKKLEADEKARVKAQKERLGEEGLKELAKKLEDAKAENDREVPSDLIERFEIPGTDSIHFISSTTARSGLARKMGQLDNDVQKIVDQNKSDLPLFIHFEHIPTNFVHMYLIFSTGSVPQDLKPLLIVYLMNFFNTPMERDGQRIEFEQVVTELEGDTITYDINGGSGVGNSELLRIKFIVEPEKYERTVKWLKDLLFNSIFDAEVCPAPSELRIHAKSQPEVKSHRSQDTRRHPRREAERQQCKSRSLAATSQNNLTGIDGLRSRLHDPLLPQIQQPGPKHTSQSPASQTHLPPPQRRPASRALPHGVRPQLPLHLLQLPRPRHRRPDKAPAARLFVGSPDLGPRHRRPARASRQPQGRPERRGAPARQARLHRADADDRLVLRALHGPRARLVPAPAAAGADGRDRVPRRGRGPHVGRRARDRARVRDALQPRHRHGPAGLQHLPVAGRVQGVRRRAAGGRGAHRRQDGVREARARGRHQQHRRAVCGRAAHHGERGEPRVREPGRQGHPEGLERWHVEAG